jgi:glyoxylase-like metal-dependent hydrolase (beta-lactamase superfamily II)
MVEIKVLVEGHHEVDDVEGKVNLASTVTLIKGEQNILVDTGSLCDGEKILAGLKEEGLTPDKIDFVILTHLHLDHILNVHLFKNSKVLCKFSPKYPGQKHDFSKGCIYRTELIDGTDIMGGVSILLTPGHTWDSLSVVVKNEEGTYVISGDALASEAFVNLEKKPFEVATFDLEKFDESRRKILAIANYIIPGHGKMFKIN